jgi:hypothetical protein
MTIGDLHPYSEIHLPSSRHKRRASNWSRPPAPKSISELMAERSWAHRIVAIDPTAINRIAAEEASTALTEGQWRAATEFGAPHAWRPTRRGFSIEALAGFYNSKRRYRRVSTPRGFNDHGWCFRWARGHAPAALVGQPYKPAFDLAKAQAFARENELLVSVADAFESWHNPGECLLVVWTRGEPGTNGVGHNYWMTPR